MNYFLSIVLILGGGLVAWKPQIWLGLTRCRGGCQCTISEWARMRTRVGGACSALLGVACLISLIVNL